MSLTLWHSTQFRDGKVQFVDVVRLLSGGLDIEPCCCSYGMLQTAGSFNADTIPPAPVSALLLPLAPAFEVRKLGLKPAEAAAQ